MWLRRVETGKRGGQLETREVFIIINIHRFYLPHLVSRCNRCLAENAGYFYLIA